jgi:hypothetical protein
MDIVTEVFLKLRNTFFDERGKPLPFSLRDKRNTQDDPLDEHLALNVLGSLPTAECLKASGPLITPDMVLYRPHLCSGAALESLSADLNLMVGIEVKKLERTQGGKVARASGLDYNTTPPCGRIRIYDATNCSIDIRGFYVFVCMEPDSETHASHVMSALTLIDGNALNADFALYLSIVGQREKRIGLGTYGDGVDRARPMLIFANPLGAPELDHAVTLVHPSPVLHQEVPMFQPVHVVNRNMSTGEVQSFVCYRLATDVPDDWTVASLTDPFPTPTRDALTAPRGRFKLPFTV